MPRFDLPDEMRVAAGARVAFLWAGTGALPWWYSEAGGAHTCEMLAVALSSKDVRVGQQRVPAAEWLAADPFSAASWRTTSPYDLVTGRTPETVRVTKALAVDFDQPALMAVDLAVNIGRRAALFVPPEWSLAPSGDAFRERFGRENEQAIVDRFRAAHPSLRCTQIRRPSVPPWDTGDPWGSRDLVLAWNDPETTDVVVTVSAGPSGIHVVHHQAAE